MVTTDIEPRSKLAGPCQTPAMSNWPLVGRREELIYVLELINDPSSRGALLAGAAGVGKTRLLSEAIGSLDGYHVERATATRSAQQLPFGALAQLLPDGIPGDRADLLPVIGRTLRRRAGDRPVVLAVDDAHLLDPLSAAFVHYAATTGAAKTLLSMRSGEAAPDAIVALYRDDVLPRLELQPISRGEFDELVGAALGGHVESASLDRLWAAAAGNVLYVRELMLDAAEAGALRQEHGVWRWAGRVGAAPRLREIVFDRVGHLSAGRRRLLDLLALAEPLGTAIVEQLSPDEGLDDAEQQGLVLVEINGRRTEVRLGHPLFGEAIDRALGAGQRRRLYRMLADALEATGARRRADVLRLAMWRLEAGDPADAEMLTGAAEMANGLADFELGERLAREAMNAGAGFGAALQLGRALCEQGRSIEADAILQPLEATESLTDADRAALADARVTAVGHGLGYINDAIEILVEAEAHVAGPEVRALLQAHRAALLAFAARFDEAAVVGHAALTVVHDDATRVRAISSVGSSLNMSGKFEQALALSDELLPIALRLQDQLPRAPLWVFTNRVTALILSGHLDDASALFDVALASLPYLDPLSRAQVSTYQGRIALARGKPGTARRLLGEAIAVHGEGGTGPLASWARSLHAEARALLGDTASVAAKAPVTEPKDDATGNLAFDADARRARAWVDATEGRTSDAVAGLATAADLARSRGQAVFELLALGDALRLGEHGLAPRAEELAATIEGPWAAAIGLHATAVGGDDAVRFETAAVAFEAMGSDLVAAELLAIASSMHGRAGMRARSTATARRGRALQDQCEGAGTPQLGWAADAVPLSRREREVASMAAQGHTNAEIASALHVSVRTVESHLYSTYAKLGITERNQLSDVLA